MRIPILGHVGYTPFDIGGHCSNKGFKLGIKDRCARDKLEFTTKNYSKKDEKEKMPTTKEWLIALGILIIVMSGLVTALTFIDRSLFDSLVHCIFYNILACITLLSLIIYFVTCFTGPSDQKEWHACEHKSALLLEARLQPTIKNLKSCSSASISCGSVMLGIIIEVLIFILIHESGINPALTMLILKILLTYMIIVGCLFIPILLIALLWDLISRSKKTKRFWLLILSMNLMMLPCILLPFLLQKLFFVKEPSQEKLESTTKELKQFIETHQLYEIKNPVK